MYLRRTAIVAGVVGLLGASLAATAISASPARNGIIAFTLFDRGGSQIAWIVPAQPTRVHVIDSLNGAGSVSWSPNGRRLVVETQLGLYVANSDGSHKRRLTFANGPAGVFDGDPSWSPNGKLIAFTRAGPRFGRGLLLLVRPNGRGLRKVTYGAGASWSPDGRWIAFQYGPSTEQDVYRVHPDGSGRTRLTTAPGDDTSPEWSPDGRRIVFVGARDGNDEIYAMNPEGRDQMRLTRVLRADVNPSWSPDGRFIVFGSQRVGHRYGLYLMRPDGADQRRLASGPWDAGVPHWQPLPAATAKARG